MKDRSVNGLPSVADGGRVMTLIMAVMLFLTVLIAAFGIGTTKAAHELDRALAGRLTVQIPDGTHGSGAAARVLTLLRNSPDVARADLVDPAELAKLLEPWLGSESASGAFPVPAMIDVDLVLGDDASVRRIEDQVRSVSTTARIDRQAAWMSPVSGLLSSLRLLTGGIMLLMIGATAAIIGLSVRARLEEHRETIEVMHMLGSSDAQLAGLFQRSMAQDVAIGGGLGAIIAIGVVTGLGGQLGQIGSQLLGGMMLSAGSWAMLALLPLGFTILAMAVAHGTVIKRLRRMV